MKAKLLALLAQLKGYLGSLPLPALLIGAAAGYLAHGPIKLVVDAALGLAKLVFKL